MVLTPQARALAAFALAVTVILGSWMRAGDALVQLVGGMFSDGFVAAFVASLVPLVVAVLAFVLARGVAVDGQEAGWEAHVAGAARVLALAALALVLLVLIAGLVQGFPLYARF